MKKYMIIVLSIVLCAGQSLLGVESEEALTKPERVLTQGMLLLPESALESLKNTVEQTKIFVEENGKNYFGYGSLDDTLKT